MDITSDGEDEREATYESHSQPLPSFSYVTPRDRLQAFLDAPQAPFVASKHASLSTTSRRPRFFDLHLHPQLQMRRIVLVEDIPERIASICDDWIDTHLLYMGTSTTFPFDEPLIKVKSSAREMNESTLAHTYHNKFGLRMTTVASALIFKRPDWESVFEFRLFPQDSHIGKTYATPDGFLCVTRSEDDNMSPPIIDALAEDDRNAIKTIVKHNLHHIVLWEFKSLSVGRKQALDKFVTLAGDFKWPVCSRETAGGYCNDARHDQDGVICTTGRKVGFDARDVRIISDIYSTPTQTNNSAPLIQFKFSSTANLKSDLNPARVSSDVHVVDDSPEDSDSDMVSSRPAKGSTARASTSKKKASSTSKSSYRGLRGKKATVDKAASSSRTTTAKAISKVKKSRRRGDLKPVPQKSDHMGVQIWSELIKFDATFIILNAGNYELICIRCRATNTLYISRVFGVDDPIYRKTQISLHALAFYDARDRARQLEALEETANPTFPFSYYLTIHHDPYPPVHQDAASLPLQATHQPNYEDLLDDLEEKVNFHFLLPRILYSKGQHNRVICSLAHGLPLESRPLPPSSTGNSETSSWTLELSDRITERVYPVVARNQTASFSETLVVKVAENDFEYNQLLYEYKIHRRFEAESFGVKTFGILTVPDSQIRLLLMERSGFSLDEIRRKKKILSARQHKDNYLDAIKALHTLGFLHGNLKGSHFLMSPEDGRVTLVSYKHTPFNRSLLDQGERKADVKGKGKATSRGKETTVSNSEKADVIARMKIEEGLATELRDLI